MTSIQYLSLAGMAVGYFLLIYSTAYFAARGWKYGSGDRTYQVNMGRGFDANKTRD